jgi:hypothetical protein
MKNISQIVRVLAAVLIGATLISTLAHAQQTNPNRLRPCPKPDYSKKIDIGIGGRTEKWTKCWGVVTVRGMVLEGEWVNGNLNGQGTTTFPNGEKYVGEYKDGKKNGQGTYYFLADNQSKGDKYVGEFKDGKYHGQGTYTFASGAKHVGEYKDGLKNGQGTYTFASGDKYVGEYKDDKENGQGTYTKTNIGKYVGEFKDGMYNGQGMFTYVNGEQQEGIWENNNFIREAKVNLPNLNNNITTNTDRTDVERERQQLAEERRRLEEDKRQQQAENNQDNNPNKRPAVADSRRRLALVIGNAAYKNSPLRNPTNDADLISNALSKSGFIVSRYDNLTYARMREVVRIFGEKLNRGDVGLFYFSGHGVQYRGKNYLLPINDDFKHADEIPSTAMDIDLVLAKMETAKNDLNIVILDACRSSPFGSEARNLDRGLTTISAAKGTFVAFATSPGNIALDGTGRNSPYTKNLAQAILKGGLTLEQVFKEVRRNVISETNSQQVPWENSSLLGDFYFK